MKHYVIVGNGIAAAGCIEGIRSADRTADITVLSAERHPVYCRPLISYYLEGKTDLSRLPYRPDGFYEDNRCTVRYGCSAVRLDPQQKELTLDDGSRLSYDAVCVAAGSSPFVPPMEGLDTVPSAHAFMTWDDALAIERELRPDSRVLIVGAGLIGLKCAEGLCGRVGSLTVCDLADRILSSILDTESAALLQRQLERHGVSFRLGDSAARFEGNTAYMRSGAAVPFDLLILAVGVRANTALVREAGGACGRGITVDSAMRTSLPDVFAAGDCTEAVDVSDGTVRVMALLPNAYRQGHCAGINMAGGNDVFDDAIPMNSIGFFGCHAMTAGSRPTPEQGGEVYEESDGEHLKRLFLRDGRLVGYILIGAVERAGIYTDLIRSRTPLAEIDFENLKKNPNLSAFPSIYRRKILGGVV